MGEFRLAGWVVPAVSAAGFAHARHALPHLEPEEPRLLVVAHQVLKVPDCLRREKRWFARLQERYRLPYAVAVHSVCRKRSEGVT